MVVQLTALFGDSTTLLLAYSVPLLLFSLLLTFAGTFLTLDRTRSFAPRSDTIPSLPGAFEKATPAKKWSFRLDGGIGGIAIGYAFGLHFATFLSLLIINETSAKPLSPTAFFVTWLFSVLPPMVIAGRWRIAALVFLGVSGGITLSLALSIITHPSLTSRVVLASIVTPFTTLAVLIPSLIPGLSQSKLTHSNARAASSCLGAFSVTMAIALLTRSPIPSSWANAWERLWVANGPGWGTSRERGFDALFCSLWAVGALSDWALKRWIGEDPEEKWDAYLSEYSASLPNARDRAGKFVPLQSWWTRLLRNLHLTSTSPTHPREVIFPEDKDFSSKTIYSPVPDASDDAKPATHLSREDLQRSISPGAYVWEPSIASESLGVLRKGKSRRGEGFKRVLGNDASHVDSERTVLDLGHQPTFLQNAKNAKTKHRWRRLAENRRRAPVEFRPKEGFSSESDTEESSNDDQLKTPSGTPRKGVHTRNSPLTRVDSRATTLSGTTVHPPSNPGSGNGGQKLVVDLDVDAEKARLMTMKTAFGDSPRALTPVGIAPEYSDVEEDVTRAYERSEDRSRYDDPGWKPDFLKRALSSGSQGSDGMAVKSTTTSPPGAVPMTPSLVYALGRIAKAQADAYSPSPDKVARTTSPSPHHDSPDGRPKHITIAMNDISIPGLPVTEGRKRATGDKKAGWDAFWREIRSKAAEI